MEDTIPPPTHQKVRLVGAYPLPQQPHRTHSIAMKVNAAVVAILACMANVSTAFSPSTAQTTRTSSSLFSTATGRHNEIVFSPSTTIRIQGTTLRTCPLDPTTESIQLSLTGPSSRPVVCEVQLWSAPTYVPLDIKVYLEEGNARPFNCVLKTPGSGNTLGIRNTSSHEYPATARVEPDAADMKRLMEMPQGDLIQGSALRSYPLDARTNRVVVMLKSQTGTYGSKLAAYVELLQGPNNVKQMMEIYGSDGYKRPLFVVFETPGDGNLLRVRNDATQEFPLYCSIEPY